MKYIKLMPDYGSFPLWEGSLESFGNIDPDTLPLSDDIRSRLAKVAERYDATLNHDDPNESGFPNEQDQLSFENEVKALAKDLQDELGNDFDVSVQV